VGEGHGRSLAKPPPGGVEPVRVEGGPTIVLDADLS